MVSQRYSKARIYDCIVIGAGPAGMAAATQLKRSGHSVLLLEKHALGGLLNNAHRVENYLGYLKIPGKDLISKMKAHLKQWDIPWRKEEVLEVVKKRDFEVRTKTLVLTCRSVILATGTKPKQWLVDGMEPIKAWIFYEWRALERKIGKRRRVKVGVIGGGDSAFDFALHLKKVGQEPILFVRNEPDCLPLLLDRARKAKLKIFKDTEINQVKKQGKTLQLASTKGNFKVDFVLAAIGREVCAVKMPPNGTPGLCHAGDVQNGAYRQVAIAAGDGLKAAMRIREYLSSLS